MTRSEIWYELWSKRDPCWHWARATKENGTCTANKAQLILTSALRGASFTICCRRIGWWTWCLEPRQGQEVRSGTNGFGSAEPSKAGDHYLRYKEDHAGWGSALNGRRAGWWGDGLKAVHGIDRRRRGFTSNGVWVSKRRWQATSRWASVFQRWRLGSGIDSCESQLGAKCYGRPIAVDTGGFGFSVQYVHVSAADEHLRLVFLTRGD